MMIQIARRNILLFFRDRSAVFFSLLAVFIVIGLYALFLGDNLRQSVAASGVQDVDFLMNSWIMAGILSVTSVTTTMGAFGIMVEDRSKKISRDFASSPLKKSSLAGGYILSAVTVGILMSLLTLTLAEIYLVCSGGSLLPLPNLLQTLGLVVLSVLASSSFLFFLVTFFRSQNAFATASTIIGTLIGFLTGIYIPIGSLPEAVQWVIRIFPISHSASLLRETMMAVPLASAFDGAPAQMLAEFQNTMGITYQYGDFVMPAWGSLLILLLTTAVFYGLSIWNLSRKKER